MRPLVFNSTPLIYLTKVGLSEVLEHLKGEKLTSPRVKREVVYEGKRKGVPDAIVLHRLFENNLFKVVEPKDQKLLSRLIQTKGLHITDADVLTIAKERKGQAVIDEEVARKTAKIYGILYVGTPYILMRAVLQKLITKERAKHAVDDIVSSGWRCNVETYAKIIEALDRSNDASSDCIPT